MRKTYCDCCGVLIPDNPPACMIVPDVELDLCQECRVLGAGVDLWKAAKEKRAILERLERVRGKLGLHTVYTETEARKMPGIMRGLRQSVLCGAGRFSLSKVPKKAIVRGGKETRTESNRK